MSQESTPTLYSPHEEQTLNAMATGGGSGLKAILRAMPTEVDGIRVNRVAGVTVSDEGGSSRELSEILDIIPVGDLRQAVIGLSGNVALEAVLDDRSSRSPDEVHTRLDSLLWEIELSTGASEPYDEALAGELVQETVRVAETVAENKALENHPVGNLMIAAAARMAGRVTSGMTLVTNLLRIDGTVLPLSERRNRLLVVQDGKVKVAGEHRIDHTPYSFGQSEIAHTYNLDESAPLELIEPDELEVTQETETALQLADLYLTGVGSIDTSVLAYNRARMVAVALRRGGAYKAVIQNLIAQDNILATLRQQIDKVEVAIGGMDALVLNTNPGTLESAGLMPLTLSTDDEHYYARRGVRLLRRDMSGFRTDVPKDKLAAHRSQAIHDRPAVSSAISEITANVRGRAA